MPKDFSDYDSGLSSPIAEADEYSATEYATTDIEIDPPCRLLTVWGKSSGTSYVEFELVGSSAVLREDLAAKQRLEIPYRVSKIKSGSTASKVRVAW